MFRFINNEEINNIDKLISDSNSNDSTSNNNNDNLPTQVTHQEKVEIVKEEHLYHHEQQVLLTQEEHHSNHQEQVEIVKEDQEQVEIVKEDQEQVEIVKEVQEQVEIVKEEQQQQATREYNQDGKGDEIQQYDLHNNNDDDSTALNHIDNSNDKYELANSSNSNTNVIDNDNNDSDIDNDDVDNYDINNGDFDNSDNDNSIEHDINDHNDDINYFERIEKRAETRMKLFRDKITKFVYEWRSENSALSVFSNCTDILLQCNYVIDINNFLKILQEFDIEDDSAKETFSLLLSQNNRVKEGNITFNVLEDFICTPRSVDTCVSIMLSEAKKHNESTALLDRFFVEILGHVLKDDVKRVNTYVEKLPLVFGVHFTHTEVILLLQDFDLNQDGEITKDDIDLYKTNRLKIQDTPNEKVEVEPIVVKDIPNEKVEVLPDTAADQTHESTLQLSIDSLKNDSFSDSRKYDDISSSPRSPSKVKLTQLQDLFNRFVSSIRSVLLDKSTVENAKRKVRDIFGFIHGDATVRNKPITRIELKRFLEAPEMNFFEGLEDYRSELQEMFLDQLDSDRDNSISVQEMEDFLFPNTNDVEVGVIMQFARKALKNEMGPAVFSLSPINFLQSFADKFGGKVKNGTLDIYAVRKALQKVKIKELTRLFNEAEVDALIKHLDANGDGILSARELRDWLFPKSLLEETKEIMLPVVNLIHSEYNSDLSLLFESLSINGKTCLKADFSQSFRAAGGKHSREDPSNKKLINLILSDDNENITFNSIKAALELAEIKDIKMINRRIDAYTFDLSVDLEGTNTSAMSCSPSPRKKSTRYELKPKEKPVYPDIAFHVEGESMKKDWKPNGKAQFKSPKHKKVVRLDSTKLIGTEDVDDSINRISPRRKRIQGPMHLGGGAAGEGEKQLAAAGYKHHWGKWRGYPYDNWSCCKSNQTTCIEPNPALKVIYKEVPKITKIEKSEPEVPLPAAPIMEKIEDIRKDEYFGQGTFQFNMKSASTSGNGVLNFQNGMYDGEIVDSVPHGIGKFVYYDTNTVYEGEVSNGYFEGKGELKCGLNRYVGTFKNHKKEGQGIYYFEDGSVYEGEYKNDCREGMGKIKYFDGDCYEGHWANGMREGKGTYKFSNGDEYNGTYANDLREGKGKYKVAATGKEVIGRFKAGNLVQGDEGLTLFAAENSSNSKSNPKSKSSKKDPSETYANYVKNNISVSKPSSKAVQKHDKLADTSISRKQKNIDVQGKDNTGDNNEGGEKKDIVNKLSKSSNNILATALKTIEKKVNTIISSTEMMKDMEKQKQIIRVLQQEIYDLKNQEATKALKYLKKKDELKQKEISMSAKAWKPPIAPKYLTNSRNDNVPVSITKYVTRAEKEEVERRDEEIRSKLTAPSDVNVKLSKPKSHFSRRDSPSPTKRIITTSSPIKTNSRVEYHTKKKSDNAGVTQVTVSNYEAAAMLIMAADLAASNHERFLKLANDDEYTTIPQVIFEKDNTNTSEETLVIKKQSGILDTRFSYRKDISEESRQTANTKRKEGKINIADIIGDSTTWWNNIMKKKNQIEMKELQSHSFD